jgi:hypothetical protein
MSKYLPATLGLAAMLIASTSLAQDCVVAATDGLSNALPAKPNADVQRKLYEEKIWGRTPVEGAAAGDFPVVKGVTEENGFYNISGSVLNREAMWRITFGSGIVDPAKPSVTVDLAKPSVTADPAKPLASADPTKPLPTVDPAKPGSNALRFALSALTQFAPPPAFWVPPIIVAVLPTFSEQWIELDPTYTIAIKARLSC